MIPTILLTFDIEDWFQVENFKQCIPFSSWPNYELRVEKNLHRILDLLDSIKLNNQNVSRESASRKVLTHNPQPAAPQHRNTSPSLCAMRSAPRETLKATFFILGWIAERLPGLVREIQARGHEVASHGYDHKLCYELSAEYLLENLIKSKDILENLTGSAVYGYRAPSFSISDDILDLIKRAGYLYDSSFNSFGLNKRYGRISLNGNNGNGILHKLSDSFYEIPISNVAIGGKILPWGGGGYFRLIPSQLFKYGVQSILKKQGAYLFYMHPWEIDPEQPRVTDIPASFKFRHYVNLDKTYRKLSMFLESLKDYSFQTCFEYLSNHC